MQCERQAEQELQIELLTSCPTYQYLEPENFLISLSPPPPPNSHHHIALLARLVSLFKVRDDIANGTTNGK